MTCPNCGAALIQTSTWLDEISGFTILTLRCEGCDQWRLSIEKQPQPVAEQGTLFAETELPAEGRSV